MKYIDRLVDNMMSTRFSVSSLNSKSLLSLSKIAPLRVNSGLRISVVVRSENKEDDFVTTNTEKSSVGAYY